VGSKLQPSTPPREGKRKECFLSSQLSANGVCGALMLQNTADTCNKFVLLKIINLESLETGSSLKYL